MSGAARARGRALNRFSRCRLLALALAVANAITGGGAAAAALTTRSLTPVPGAAGQAIRIDIRGAVARGSVTRPMSCPSATGSGRSTGAAVAATAADAVLDIALPPGAALLDVTVVDHGRPQATRPIALTKARDAYAESVRALGVSASEIPFQDEARYRIHIACSARLTNRIIDLHYTFAALLEFVGGRFRLAFPAAAELTPPSTRVEVSAVSPGGLAEVSIAGAAHPARGRARTEAIEIVSTRSPWIVSLLPLQAQPAGAGRGDEARLIALTTAASWPHGRGSWLAYAVGATTGARRDLPGRVWFLIDRSRSVGPGGLEAERDFARRLLDAMPPATRFDALFFDRAVKRLFPLARAATRETMGALDEEMTPAQMGNGTDLPGVLRAARDLLKREAEDFSPHCLLVLLTDGAVGTPEHAAELPALLRAPNGVELSVAVVSVRPNDDPPVSAPERRVLRRLAAAASHAGVERTLKRADLADEVPMMLEALRVGGDVYGISFGPAAAGQADQDRQPGQTGGGTGSAEVREVVEVLVPGGGASGVVSTPGTGGSRNAAPRTIVYRGSRRPVPIRPVIVDQAWLAPLADPRAADARLLIGPGLSAMVEPVIRPPASDARADANFNPAGYMERSVVRDALSLAFTPRARACYLNRSAKTAADRDLTGRVRLALDLVRGEVASVRLESSTLAHPAIEACLREAAYAIEVPRAYRNDEAVTAVLNLVFKPRTPDRHATDAENPSVSREIDLMVEAALKEGAMTRPGSAAPPPPASSLPRPAAGADPDAAAPDGSR